MIENEKQVAIELAVEYLKITPDEDGLLAKDDLGRLQILLNDAEKDKPMTAAGKELKKKVKARLKELNDEVTKFDFNNFKDSQLLPAVYELFQLIASKTDYIFKFSIDQGHDELVEKNLDTIILESFEIMKKHNVPLGHYHDLFSRLKNTIEHIEKGMVEQITGHKAEIESRLLGAKNPKFNKFDKSYATYEDIKTALEKVRNETGNDPKDYFNMD